MRLFIALWPGERIRRSLAQVADSLASIAGGKPVPAAKIHLTLAFLGEVEPEREADAREAAMLTSARRFELRLDEVGSFRGAGVAWAGPSHVPTHLVELQSRLAGALRAGGFTLDERPFVAHVTLVRKIGNPVPRAPIPVIRWRPHGISLVRSENATGRYVVVETWPLERG